MIHHYKTFIALAALASLLSVTLVVNAYFLKRPPPPFDTFKATGRESFLAGIPQMIDPTKRPPPSADAANAETPAAVQADADWRSILAFVQQNPEKAPAFLADMKAKFFDAACTIKQPRIDFANLADSYQPIFSL